MYSTIQTVPIFFVSRDGTHSIYFLCVPSKNGGYVVVAVGFEFSIGGSIVEIFSRE